MTVYDVCISDWSSDVCSADLHGVIVASAVVRQYRLLDPKSPIEVYAANPFGLTKNAAGKSFLKLDFKQAEKALEWMHSKGVRTVVTAFNSSNQLGSFNFMNKAEQLGMTVFAAYSNERSEEHTSELQSLMRTSYA